MTYGKGGLIRDITSFLRDKYLQDEDFKTLIDSLNTDFFYDFFSEIFTIMIKNNDSFGIKYRWKSLNHYLMKIWFSQSRIA